MKKIILSAIIIVTLCPHSTFTKPMDRVGLIKDKATQPDGKMLQMTRSDNDHGYDFIISRYNPDESLDTSFGVNGKVTLNIGGEGYYPLNITLQNDGKIIVLSSNQSNSSINLTRFLTNGSIDTSFGQNGMTWLPYNAQEIIIHYVTPDRNKLIVMGTLRNESQTNIPVMRFLNNGEVDRTFTRVSKR